MKYQARAALITLFLVPTIWAFQTKTKIEQTSATQSRLEIECTLLPEEILFHNSLQFSSNIPSIKIVKWFALKEPHTYFDPRSKKSDPVYSGAVNFTLIIESTQEISSQAIIHMYYQTNLTKNPQEKFFPIGMPHEDLHPEETTKSTLPYPQTPIKNYTKSPLAQFFNDITKKVTSLITDKELPLMVKFLLAFIIGLLISFTPCIYPMIPITMGILHSNKAHSLLRGFSLASAYTAGISMTFALLGMIAAYGGAQLGSTMTSPWVIVPIVIFFAYLAFSMLGFYEMYIPRVMQPRHGQKNNGSLLSAFTFGMINGTVASPCLAPGLTLILGIASGLEHALLGFLLLFIFGIGLSFPLLIIGTFSSSLHLLPRAGMWMIEFKKVFGFILLGMCIYYVKAFMVEWVYCLVLGLYLIVVAAYYISYGFKHRAWLAHATGIITCVVAGFMLKESYRALVHTETTLQHKQKFTWTSGYEASRTHAQAEHKLLLLDFTANWCSLCKKLEKDFFNEEFICNELPRRVVALKIDCTDTHNAEALAARKKCGVMGCPAIVLMNPADETVLQRWDSGLIQKDPHEFIHEIDSFIR